MAAPSCRAGSLPQLRVPSLCMDCSVLASIGTRSYFCKGSGEGREADRKGRGSGKAGRNRARNTAEPARCGMGVGHANEVAAIAAHVGGIPGDWTSLSALWGPPAASARPPCPVSDIRPFSSIIGTPQAKALRDDAAPPSSTPLAVVEAAGCEDWGEGGCLCIGYTAARPALAAAGRLPRRPAIAQSPPPAISNTTTTHPPPRRVCVRVALSAGGHWLRLGVGCRRPAVAALGALSAGGQQPKRRPGPTHSTGSRTSQARKLRPSLPRVGVPPPHTPGRSRRA